MNLFRKRARDWLEQSSRRSFYSLVDEARLTPEEMDFIDLRFNKCWSCVKIGLERNMSERNVKRIITKAYDKINRALDSEI